MPQTRERDRQDKPFCEHYLIWDADAIALHPLEFFDKDGKAFVEKASEHHKPYFDTLERLNLSLGSAGVLRKAVNFSFIAENLMVECAKMSELIALIESTHKKAFFEAILEAIEPVHLGQSGFSEYESYGNFIALKYPQSFVAINRKRDRFAKRILGTPNARLLRYWARDFEVAGFEVWTAEDKRFSKILKMRILGAFFRLFPPKFYVKICKKLNKFSSFWQKFTQKFTKNA